MLNKNIFKKLGLSISLVALIAPFLISRLTPTTVASSVDLENYRNRRFVSHSFPTMRPFPTFPSELLNNRKRISIPSPRIDHFSIKPFPSITVSPSLEPTRDTPTPKSTSTVTPSTSAISTPTASATAQATSTPNTSTTVSPTASPTPTASSNVDQVISLVNQERAKQNLTALTKNDNLAKSAADYAHTMATNNFFSHDGQDGSTFISRNTQAGYDNYTFLAENIAAGQATPEAVMQAWMNSEGHRKNILSTKAKEIGVGVATNSNSRYGIYWVQEFGAR